MEHWPACNNWHTHCVAPHMTFLATQVVGVVAVKGSSQHGAKAVAAATGTAAAETEAAAGSRAQQVVFMTTHRMRLSYRIPGSTCHTSSRANALVSLGFRAPTSFPWLHFTYSKLHRRSSGIGGCTCTHCRLQLFNVTAPWHLFHLFVRCSERRHVDRLLLMAVPCHAMLCYAMLCHVVLHHAVSCCAVCRC